MEKVTRCKACRRKNTMQEVEADGQTAMQCTNCTWLDPESIKNVEELENEELYQNFLKGRKEKLGL